MAFFHGLVEAGAAVQAEGAGTIDIPALMQQVAAEQGYSPWLQPSRVADDAPMRPVTTLRPRNSRES
jgi:hypothetical protein